MYAANPDSGELTRIEFESFLYGKQIRKIKPRPDLVFQFAHYVGDVYKSKYGVTPEIYADVLPSLPFLFILFFFAQY